MHLNKPTLNLNNVIKNYTPLIKSIIRKNGFSGEEIEDISQDVALKIYINFNKYSPNKGKISTWIYTITERTVIDYKRGRNYNKDINTISFDLVNYREAYELDVDSFDISYFNNLLLSLMEGLNKKQAEILKLFYFKGMKYSEISEKVKLPVNRIGVEKYRAELTLKNKLFKLRIDKKSLF